ncbi:MAG: hypothetical protein WC522_09015 [Candidatus Omnitrophota bacterium]
MILKHFLVRIFTIIIFLAAAMSITLSAAGAPILKPTIAEIKADSKSATLSAVDKLWLRTDVLMSGTTKIKTLVNIFTNKVEYVWSVYNCYVRPDYVLPNAQTLYNETHS